MKNHPLNIVWNYLKISITKRHVENIDFKPEHITSLSTLCKILSLLDDAYKYKIREQINEENLIEEALELLKNPKAIEK